MESGDHDPWEQYRITLADGLEVVWDPNILNGYDLEKYRRLKASGAAARAIAAEAREDGLRLGKGERSWAFAHHILNYLLRFDAKVAKEAVLIEFGLANSFDEHCDNLVKGIEASDVEAIQTRVNEQLVKITNAQLSESLRKFLVAPRCEMRDWDFGSPGEQFPCWIVLEHVPSNSCIAYCEQGFGPATPWGILLLRGKNGSMGLDCNWSETLEEAFRCTRAWEGG